MPRKSRKNVGLIGLGIIGARAAAGLRASGYQVFVWNRTPKPAPNFLGSPAEVADICEIIQLFVADSQATFEMIEAISDSLTPRHIVISNGTIGPEATLEAARMVQARGAQFLDAPFTGSKGAADRSQLVYYVGGDEAVYLRAKPVLESTSKAIVRCGKIGDAATLKVATNLITAVTTQTLAEALAITRKSGINPEAFAAALEHNACRSGVVELKMPKMVTGDYDPHFSLKHMFKDVQLGIHLANSLDLEVPATTVTAGVMYGALNNGWADLDFASVFKIYDGAMPQIEEPAALPDRQEHLESLPDATPAEPAPDALSPFETPELVPEQADVFRKEEAQHVSPPLAPDETPKEDMPVNAPPKDVTELSEPPAEPVEASFISTEGSTDDLPESTAEGSGEKEADDESKLVLEGEKGEPDSNGDGAGVKRVRPFNRIMRRLFSSAGK